MKPKKLFVVVIITAVIAACTEMYELAFRFLFQRSSNTFNSIPFVLFSTGIPNAEFFLLPYQFQILI